MGTWEEMAVSWRHDSLFDYTPNVLSKLIVDKMNKKYGIVSVDTDSVFYGGHMNGKTLTECSNPGTTNVGTWHGGHMKDIKGFEKELGIKHNYLSWPWEKSLTVKKIIHSGPCTIVIWGDGEKTIVRQSKHDSYDEYTAFCAAFCKRFFGSTSAVKKLIDKKTVPYRPTKVEKESEEAKWIRDGYGLFADSKEQADRLKDRIINRITMFGRLSIAGLYEIFEDNSKPVLDEYYYGWDSVNNIYYKKKGAKYWFYLPKPKQIMKRNTDAGAGTEDESK